MLFINPAISEESQPEFLTSFVYTCFPIGIGFLAKYLETYNGATVQVIDEHIRSLTHQKLKAALDLQRSPRIVGISCLTITAKRGYQLAREIKQIDPDTIVILGGIHPAVMPEECLQKDGVDIVVRGEGEATLSELYDSIKNDTPYNDIDGISYVYNGEIRHNPSRDLIDDLDLIPEFPYDLYEKDIDRYRDFGTLMTSRGCPFSCIFCSQRAISGKRYRYHSVDRSLKELDLLINKYGQQKIWFIEDNFAVNRKRVFALADAIIANGYHHKAEFLAAIRADSVDRELLTELKQANFSMFAIGAETGSERLMKLINKQETVDQNIKAIRLANEFGIKVSAAYIYGLPTETRKERKETFQLTKKLPVDNVRFNTAIPYPGTPLYTMAQNEKRLKIRGEWENFNVQYYLIGDDIPYYPENTNKYLLIYDTMMANLRTYLCFRGLKSILLSPLSGGSVISKPKHWSIMDLIRLMKLGVFLIKRFAYIFYKANIVARFTRQP